MGHTRLGSLPRTKKWREVVNLLTSQSDLSKVTGAIIDASHKAFSKLSKDDGLDLTFWLITQVPLAAKKEDFSAALESLDIYAPKNPGIFETIASFNECVERTLRLKGRSSDLAAMALAAASEGFISIVSEKSEGLFGRTSDEVKRAFASLSKPYEFEQISREFFSRFTNRYMNYFLSRELSNHLGKGKRFNDLIDYDNFENALTVYCWEVTKIIEDYSRDWYGKSLAEGFTRKKTSGFLYSVFEKIKDEFKMEDDNG